MAINSLIAATLILVAAVVRATAGFENGAQVPVAPPLLSQTGLYEGEGTQRIDARNRPFAPQYPLWTDGAEKRRWIRLPEGTTIDAADLARWEFPVGTRFWKQFSFNGRKVETRMLWRASEDRWVFAAYAWNEAQTDAVLAPETGIPGAAEIVPGKRHSIPSIADCRACHDSARTEILGFDALQLSDDRDANAPHAETLTPDMITLRTLFEERLISPVRPELVTNPPRIQASSPTERAALGYLSANCGACHNRESSIASLGLILKHSVTGAGNREPGAGNREPGAGNREPGAPECTPALATTAGKRGHWIVPEAQEASRIIDPGHPESSSLIRRVKSRRPLSQMPPLGSVLVDRAAVDLLTRWVQSDPDEWTSMIARCVANGS